MWVSTPFFNSLSQLDHLVNGLFPIEAHDVVEKQCAARFFGFARERRKEFDEHRHHHLRPAFPDQRKGAVKIEKDMPDLRSRRERRRELHQASKSSYTVHFKS